MSSYAVKPMANDLDLDKEVMLNLKVRRLLREEFKIAADMEGFDMSAMLRNFMIRTIREAKERDSEGFAQALRFHLKNLSEKPPDANGKEEKQRKTGSDFKLLPTPKEEISDMDLVALLKKKTGEPINTEHIMMYHDYIDGEDEEFLTLPKRIQEIIIDYYKSEHLQAREEEAG
jgi:hypothetical protein